MQVFDPQIIELLIQLPAEEAITKIDTIFSGGPDYGTRPQHYSDHKWSEMCWDKKIKFEMDVDDLKNSISLFRIVKDTLSHADVYICPEQECVCIKMPDENHAQIAIELFEGFRGSFSYIDDLRILQIDPYGWKPDRYLFQAISPAYEIKKEFHPDEIDFGPEKQTVCEKIPVFFLPLMSLRNLKENTAYEVELSGMASKILFYRIKDGNIEVYDGPLTADQRDEIIRESIW